MTRSWLIWGLLVAVLLCVRTSTAEASTRRARIFYKRAERLYAKQKYAAALVLYRKAYGAKALAGFHFNIGLCLDKLGKHREAATAFRRYLKRTKSRRHRARAKRLLERNEAAAKLAEKPPETPEMPPPPPKTPIVKEPVAKKSGRNYRVLKPFYFWLGTAVTTTLLVAGTVTGIVALAKSSSFKDASTPNSELRRLEDVGKATRTTSTVTFVAGAIAATATVALYFMTDWKLSERRRRGATISAAATQDGGMLTVVGRF
jgi:hypothetical protein